MSALEVYSVLGTADGPGDPCVHVHGAGARAVLAVPGAEGWETRMEGTRDDVASRHQPSRKDALMTDEPVHDADGSTRRSAFAKIGAVAAGAWVAPQVLSTQAASAQSAPPCARPVAYLNAYNSILYPYGFTLIPNQAVPFDSAYLPPVGITPQVFDPTSFTLLSAGTYRVTYTLSMGSDSTSFAVWLNGTTVPFTGLDVDGYQMNTRVVLITAQAGDVLQIAHLGPVISSLESTGSATPCASILIELVA